MDQTGISSSQPYHRDDEIDLADLFLVPWKRKWMIAVITISMTIAATGISMYLPNIYEVTAILEPGKNAEGVHLESPQSIQTNIINGAYNFTIERNLGLKKREIPKFKVSVPNKTDLVKISLESNNAAQAVTILKEILALVRTDIQQKLDLEIQTTKAMLKEAQLQSDFFDSRIKQTGSQISLAERRIDDLEVQRKEAFIGSQNDALSILLFSNEIQKGQDFLNRLQQQLAALQAQKKQNALVVERLKSELTGTQATYIKKIPTVPGKPIKPQKILIIALTFLTALMGSIMLAFIVEFINNVRQRTIADFD